MTSLAIPSSPLATRDGLQTAVWRRISATGLETIRAGASRIPLTRTVVIGNPREPEAAVEGFLALDVTVYGPRPDRRWTDATAAEIAGLLTAEPLHQSPRIVLRQVGAPCREGSLSECWTAMRFAAVVPGGGE